MLPVVEVSARAGEGEFRAEETEGNVQVGNCACES